MQTNDKQIKSNEDESELNRVITYYSDKQKAKLPFFVRCLIYSYLDLMFLINFVTKLCKQERDKLPVSEFLIQPRCLKIYIKEGKMITFPQLEYGTKIASDFEIQIEKMQEQDVFILQTIMHMINQQNKKVKFCIGLNEQISRQCFRQAILPLHKPMITILKLVLHEQSDHLIPELCSNFSFIKTLEINLNNFALNFDNLPQPQTVAQVSKLTVRKNKYLFYPLVTMAHNLIELSIYFKEFTSEVQDLTSLKNLRILDLNCISDCNGYFILGEKEYQLKFKESKKVDVIVRMNKFNLEMQNIIEKFNYQNLNLKSLQIYLNKLKFQESKFVYMRQKADLYKDQIIFQAQESVIKNGSDILNNKLIYQQNNFENQFNFIDSLRKDTNRSLDSIQNTSFTSNDFNRTQNMMTNGQNYFMNIQELKEIVMAPFKRQTNIENQNGINQQNEAENLNRIFDAQENEPVIMNAQQNFKEADLIKYSLRSFTKNRSRAFPIRLEYHKTNLCNFSANISQKENRIKLMNTIEKIPELQEDFGKIVIFSKTFKIEL